MVQKVAEGCEFEAGLSLSVFKGNKICLICRPRSEWIPFSD